MAKKGVKTKNNIQSLLGNRGWSQAFFAQKVGVAREYMCRIITENPTQKIEPSVGLAMRIAQALGVPVEEVFYE